MSYLFKLTELRNEAVNSIKKYCLSDYERFAEPFCVSNAIETFSCYGLVKIGENIFFRNDGADRSINNLDDYSIMLMADRIEDKQMQPF